MDKSLMGTFALALSLGFAFGVLLCCNIPFILPAWSHHILSRVILAILRFAVNPFLTFTLFYLHGRKVDLKAKLGVVTVLLFAGLYVGNVLGHAVTFQVLTHWYESHLTPSFLETVRWSLPPLIIYPFLVALSALAIAYSRNTRRAEREVRVEVGLLLLLLAFIVSFVGGLGIGIDLGEYRIIPILEADPHRYTEYVLDAFLCLILPLTVGLAYSIIAFVRERKSPTGVLKWWLPLMVVGGFFFFWGIYGVWWTYTNYLDVIGWLHVYGPAEIADLILKVCLAVWIGDILWMVAGFLFMLSPVFKMMEGEKDVPLHDSLTIAFLQDC